MTYNKCGIMLRTGGACSGKESMNTDAQFLKSTNAESQKLSWVIPSVDMQFSLLEWYSLKYNHPNLIIQKRKWWMYNIAAIHSVKHLSNLIVSSF